jgi:hypothetical protein
VVISFFFKHTKEKTFCVLINAAKGLDPLAGGPGCLGLLQTYRIDDFTRPNVGDLLPVPVAALYGKQFGCQLENRYSVQIS